MPLQFANLTPTIGGFGFRQTSRRLLLVASALAATLIIVLFHQSASANTEVWTAEMTVGSNDQLNFTKVGFLNIPDDLDGGLWDETGRLDNTTITYEGQDYTVNALYYTEYQGESQYLLVHSDQPIPAVLTLQFAEHQYDVADAVEIGWGESVYRWELEVNPSWAEGSIQPVSLLAP